jgi:hypothetical protein
MMRRGRETQTVAAFYVMTRRGRNTTAGTRKETTSRKNAPVLAIRSPISLDVAASTVDRSTYLQV